MTNAPEVTVEPITYDLSAQTLKFVDIDGNYAKVDVKAVASEFDGTTSRAASLNGKYYIKISATEDITAENVATAFTKKVNGVDKNLMYALEVNGTRITNYDFVIDTYTENEVENIVALNDGDLTETYSVDPGTSTYSPKDASKVAYSYLKFEGAQEAKADVLGIKVDGMNVTVPSTAVSESVVATMYVLDVTGKQTKHSVTVKVGASTVASTETAKQATVSISDGKFNVDFGTIFKGISSDVMVATDHIKLTTSSKDFFALSTFDKDADYNRIDADITFKNSDNKGVAIVGGDVRTITNADVVLPKYKAIRGADTKYSWYKNGANHPTVSNTKVEGDTYLTLVKEADKARMFGVFELQLSLLDELGNELKKIIIPVKVEAPKFEDYFQKNQYAAWDGNSFTRVLKNGDIKVTNANDKLFANAKGEAITNNSISYTYKIDDDAAYSDYSSGLSTQANFISAGIIEAIETGKTLYKIKSSSASVKASANSTAKFAYETEKTTGFDDNPSTTAYPVETTFTMKFKTLLSGIDVKYFKDNVATDEAIVYNQDKDVSKISQDNPYILGYRETTPADAKEGTPAIYNGIGLVYNGKTYELPTSSETESTIEGVTILFGTDNAQITKAVTSANVVYRFGVSKNSVGAGLMSESAPFIENKPSIGFAATMATGDKGALEFQVVDELGIQTLLSIDYVKVDEQSPVDKAQ